MDPPCSWVLRRQTCTGPSASVSAAVVCSFILGEFFQGGRQKSFSTCAKCCTVLHFHWLTNKSCSCPAVFHLAEQYLLFFHSSLYWVVIDRLVSWPWLDATNPFYHSPFSAGQGRQRIENNSKGYRAHRIPCVNICFLYCDNWMAGAQCSWLAQIRERRKYVVVSDCHSTWRETKFLILNYICNRENKVLKYFLWSLIGLAL